MNKLATMTAKDIMSAELLTVAEHWSIKTLVDFLNRHKVTGAPVLSAKRELIGVVSLSDILSFDGRPKHSIEENPLTQYYYSTLEGYTPDELGLSQGDLHTHHLVSEIMTPEIISVDADTPLPEVARVMYERGIHRVFVRCAGEIRGAISTLDILQQLADSH